MKCQTVWSCASTFSVVTRPFLIGFRRGLKHSTQNDVANRPHALQTDSAHAKCINYLQSFWSCTRFSVCFHMKAKLSVTLCLALPPCTWYQIIDRGNNSESDFFYCRAKGKSGIDDRSFPWHCDIIQQHSNSTVLSHGKSASLAPSEFTSFVTDWR